MAETFVFRNAVTEADCASSANNKVCREMVTGCNDCNKVDSEIVYSNSLIDMNRSLIVKYRVIHLILLQEIGC